MWVTVASTSGRGGGSAIGATGSGSRTVHHPKSIAHVAVETKEQRDDDVDAHDLSSSSSGGEDIADFVDAFAPGNDDY